VELCRRIQDNGDALYYLPEAIVRHHVEAHRLTRAFFRRRSFYRGVSYALRNTIRGRPLELRYHLKENLLSLSGWVRARDAAKRFELELALWQGLGYVAKALAQTRPRRGGEERE
jgi:GT2 family glycosyltransferase